MARRDVIVIGASAGGVEALSTLVAGLPPDLPATVCVVLHIPPGGVSALPQILNRAGPLPAVHATDGMPIERGRIYVAPPDHHLLVDNEHLRVTLGPKENNHRPAVDPLFRSAARAYQHRVVGVILSGTLDDGMMGLAVVKLLGGVAVVQDPDEALFSGMPKSASDRVDVDYCLPVAEIAPVLVRLAAAEAPKGSAAMSDEAEGLLSDEEPTMENALNDEEPGTPSVFTCPECHGTLWELREGQLIHFRCRVGHAYSLDSFEAAQASALEAALWAALRALEEKQDLGERMARRAREHGHHQAATRFLARAQESAESSAVIRRAIEQTIGTHAEPGNQRRAGGRS